MSVVARGMRRLVPALAPEEELGVSTARGRQAVGLVSRERFAVALLGTGLVGLAAALPFVLESGRSVAPWTLAAIVVAYALVSRVEFEIASGMFVPTQLLLVPLLFALPLGLVPAVVAVGLVLGSLVDVVEGRLHLERAVLRVFDSWHAFGPVLVLAAFGEASPRWRDAGAYALALAAQFACETAAAGLRERIGGGLRLRVLLPLLARSQLNDAALAPVGLALAFAAAQEPLAILAVLPLAGLLALLSRERKARIDNALELSQAYRGTALLLGDVVEADDLYTGLHSRDVVELVLGVADELGLDAGGRRDAELVALLHDVGKIRIPGEIISKPAALTPEERAVMETHTVIGEQLLSQVGGLLASVGSLVRSCHERWDGAGYPDGLAGEQIPLVARIVCCCDAYSAMTTDRPYRAARTADEALAELERCAGTHFDPRVVDALVRLVERGRPRLALVA